MKYLFIFWGIFTLSNCFESNNGLIDNKAKGAWILYAMNFTDAHYFVKGTHASYAYYDTILTLNIEPVWFDTNSIKKYVCIVYDFKNEGTLRPDIMPFYGVKFYQGDSIGILAQDVVEFRFKKNDFPSDSTLYSFLEQNKSRKYSSSVMHLLELRKKTKLLY